MLVSLPALRPHCALHLRLPGLHGNEKRSTATGLHLLLPLSSDQLGRSTFDVPRSELTSFFSPGVCVCLTVFVL